MLWPAGRSMTVARRLVFCLTAIVAASSASRAAGLTRATRSDPESPVATQVAKARTGERDRSLAPSQPGQRTVIAGPRQPAPLGSAYLRLPKPAVVSLSHPSVVERPRPGATVATIPRGQSSPGVSPVSTRAPVVVLPAAVSPQPHASASGLTPVSAVTSVGVSSVRKLPPLAKTTGAEGTDAVLTATSSGRQDGRFVKLIPPLASRRVTLPASAEFAVTGPGVSTLGPTTSTAPDVMATGRRPPPAMLAAAVRPRALPAGPAVIGAYSGVTGTMAGRSGGSPTDVTPESAAVLAVKNSIDLEITAATIREAEAQLRLAYGLDDVRLTASATYGRRGPIATFSVPGPDGEPASVKLGDPEINSQQLDLTKTIYTNKRIEKAQDVALRALETRRLSRAVVSRALDLTAREIAYNVLRTEQLADVAGQRASAVAAHLDLTQKLVAGGVVPRFEAVQGETELARARGDVIAARTAVGTAKAALKRVLTLPQDSALNVLPGRAFGPPPGDESALIQQAWQQRPEIRVGEAAIKLAEASLRLAATSRNVSVNLIGGLTHTQASFGSEPLSWQVAISAQKPILDGNTERNEVGQAKAQLDAARLELEKTKQAIALDVSQAYLALDEARERLVVAEQAVVEAQEQLRIAGVRYQNGITLGVEVLDSQTAQAAARAELVNSQYNLQLSVARLSSSVGLWGGD